MPSEENPNNNDSDSVNQEPVEEYARERRETPQQQRRKRRAKEMSSRGRAKGFQLYASTC